MLPHLKWLRIVAAHPEESKYWNAKFWGAPTFEQDMEKWVNWLLPRMQCSGQYWVKNSKIEVDTNDQAEMEELVKKCLPHSYQKIQCHLAGDLIFKRGQYSQESGYWDEDYDSDRRWLGI
jgi:hypothetical protein